MQPQCFGGGRAVKAAATSCRLLITHSLFLPCPHIHLLSVVVGGLSTTWAWHGGLAGLDNPEDVRAAVSVGWMDLAPLQEDFGLCQQWCFLLTLIKDHWGDGLLKLRVTKAGEKHAESTIMYLKWNTWKVQLWIAFQNAPPSITNNSATRS